ncbi:MAG: FAD-binding and (Fe-S)-binding domain-containing protein, partial [Syntrophothermus sp.]
GTSQNSYKTLAGMKIIFSDGAVLDTNDEASRVNFTHTHPELISRICSIAARIKGSSVLENRIREKYRMKNTTGYSLNALVDFSDPIDIIQHLMIGSEGTLGFIAEVKYLTVPDYPYKATSLMLFPDTETACRAVVILKECGAEAVELMDRASLRSVEDKEGMPSYLKGLNSNVCSLLVEIRGETDEQLKEKISRAYKGLESLEAVRPVEFTTDAAEFKKLWDIRKGLFPSVGAMRKTGTTVIIEDIAFPIESLAAATLELQSIFIKHGYNDAIIFGHALEGNLHFVFKQDFNTEYEVNRYGRFINDITSMVVLRYNGALKAEHGTGRNMAPFVELEWGSEAFSLMKEIKEIFDPAGILNPGVILNADKNAHIHNLKPLPAANEIVDKCIECGFCEVNCPSRDLTLTPRQRITVYREISRLRQTGEDNELKESLLKDFDYAGNQTCATDGLCATSCPVNINTGTLIKELRSGLISPTANTAADILSSNMRFVTRSMSLLLNAVDMMHRILGTGTMEFLSLTARKLSGGALPLWNRYMPRGTAKIKPEPAGLNNELKAVYFPSCINRAMGPSLSSENQEPLHIKTASLLQKAGYDVLYPDNLDSLCCGMAYASKGFKKQGDLKSKELLNELLRKTENGRYPVYFDMSPCFYRIKEFLGSAAAGIPEYKSLKIYEPVGFISEYLSDRLEFTKTEEKIAVHATCSTIKLGLTDKLRKLAEKCSDNVIMPFDTGCCGWAGDRGFTYAELNSSALKNLGKSVKECSHGYSTSRTCEIGLSVHSGIDYDSIVYLVDRCTRKKI